MNGDQRRNGRVIGLLISIAIHLSAIGTALSITGSTPQVSAANARQPVGQSVHEAAVRPGSDGSYPPLERFVAKLASSYESDTGKWLNHLWHSTLFAFAVGLLTLAFRKNHARVRYWLWFSASVKFLIPFSALMALGSRLSWVPLPETTVVPAISFTMAQLSQPFLEGGRFGVGLALSTPDPAAWVGLGILGVWGCVCAGIVLLRARMWRRIRRAVRMSAAINTPRVVLPPGVRVRATRELFEPGVVGFWRPIILLPAGIQEDLSPAELDAVLAHELCHIKRHDNLTAALHMLVEGIFWFHPVVWWIGGRLVHEREHACDEDVLRIVREPRAYAEGILKVCKRYVDVRLACVSSVSGSDLRKRLEAIMAQQNGELLGAWRKLFLVTAGIVTLTVPVAMGTLVAPLIRAQSQADAANGPAFEVASIRTNRSPDARVTLVPQPGGRLIATNVTTAQLIRFAYDLSVFQLVGGANWLNSERFDLNAKAEGDPPVAQKRLMLRRLLAERFKLVVHTETRELPIYVLVLARSDGRPGPQLRRSEADCDVEGPSQDSGVGPPPSDAALRCGYFGFSPGSRISSGRGGLGFRGLTMAEFAKRLGPVAGRSVSDQTGLTGYFDGDFDFLAELPPPPPPPGVPSPFQTPFLSVFTVLPEQLGLKLDSRRGPVEVLVIDRVERPTEN